MKKFFILFAFTNLIFNSFCLSQNSKEYRMKNRYVSSDIVSEYKHVLYPDTTSIYVLKQKSLYDTGHEIDMYSRMYLTMNEKSKTEYNKYVNEYILITKEGVKLWVWNLPKFLRKGNISYLLQARIFHDDDTSADYASNFPWGLPALITEIRFR